MDTELKAKATKWRPQPTLPGRDYFSAETYEREKERIFYAEWFCIGREEEIQNPGDFMTAEVADESVIVTRAPDGVLHAFYNVCRHRGTRLCDGAGSAKSNVIKCPYHAWTYDLEGRLVGTPNVHEEEGLEKSDHPLWRLAVDVWDGFLWVNMAEHPKPLLDWLRDDPYDPTQFARYGMGELRVGERIVYEVRANWKIVLENYNECLHCPSVHPELVALIPIFRKGMVEERSGWYGNSLVEGATTLTRTGRSTLPPLPGLDDVDHHTYYGLHAFPNLLLNFHSDCVMSYLLLPRSTEHTTIVSEFLFRPETIAAAGFDASGIVEFWDLVSRQDWAIVERAQTGVRSRAYAKGGVYPFNDRLLAEFNKRYLAQLGDR